LRLQNELFALKKLQDKKLIHSITIIFRDVPIVALKLLLSDTRKKQLRKKDMKLKSASFPLPPPEKQRLRVPLTDL
jgi:hypothetical protein